MVSPAQPAFRVLAPGEREPDAPRVYPLEPERGQHMEPRIPPGAAARLCTLRRSHDDEYVRGARELYGVRFRVALIPHPELCLQAVFLYRLNRAEPHAAAAV